VADEPNRLRELFLAALERPTPAERDAFLDEACASDPALRRRVADLLRAHDRPDPVLDRPAAEHVAADAPTVLDFLLPPRKSGSMGRLGQYEVMEVVGRGGMGVVLRAFDEKLHRVVAIKALPPALAGSGAARERFVREARAAAAVVHDNVVGIYAVEDGGPIPYLTMQFVAGRTLQAKLDDAGPLPLRETLRIGLQIAEGLAAAHRQGLIHRDIKPANILLENSVERVRITDFGLARAIDGASLTQSGVVAGTPAYMSPEQAEGARLDCRSDLFSLGSVLYAMCAGHPPFEADSAVAVLRQICDHAPPALRQVNAAVPPWLEALVAKLQAKQPADRFASAAEVATLLGERLARLQAGLDGESEPPAGQRKGIAAKVRTSRRVVALVAGASLIAAGVAGVVYRWPAAPGTAPVNAPAPSPASLPDTYTNRFGMAFVRVPQGKAWLGGGQGVPGNREVDVPRDFYLGAFEVTQAEWQKVMGSNPSTYTRDGAHADAVKDVPDELLQRFPVDNVSWEDAQRFLAELTRAEAEPGWVYRLPTVSEREYACRGGPMTSPADGAFTYYLDRPANRIEPGQANFLHGQGLNRPCEVGSYRPNRLGLHDMYGNIYEWTNDAGRTDKGKPGYLLIGGAFWMTAEQMNWGVVLPPQNRYRDVGLRVARVPVNPSDPRREDFEAWRREVAALPVSRQAAAVTALLRVRNPAFYDQVTSRVADGAVTELSFPADDVTDLAPVRGLPGLRVLRCGGVGGTRGQLADLAPLRGLPLTTLNCRSSLVADLAPLAGMPLRDLNCENSQVTDLAPVKRLEQLTVLKCRGSHVTDFEPLRGLKLRVLTGDFQLERDAAVLRSLTALESINGQPAAAFWKQAGGTENEP
jgi:serine/threonine protein kinase